MSRDRPVPVAQGSWRSGAIHVWGWDGRDVASAAWIYGGFGRNRWSGSSNDWHESPAAYGELQRVEVDLGDGRARLAPSIRLDAEAAAVWLAGAPERELSDSLGWFARMCAFADALVGAGRIVAALEDRGPATVARWRPVLDAELTEVLDRFGSSAPPVTRVGTAVTASSVLDDLVDGTSRARLHHGGWRPEVGRRRLPSVRAVRTVFTALATGDATIRTTDPDHALAVDTMRAGLDRHRRRCAGEPVVRPRIRLTMPLDPADPWVVTAEVIDDADPGRWCTANAARRGEPAAVELAGSVEHLGVLIGAVESALEAVVERLPVLAGFGAADAPDRLELDTDEVEEFLDAAPHELARLGVDLVGPEHLVRRSVSVHGRATPAPPDDRTKRFSAEALVAWSATVDGAVLSDAELERLETAGATLLHTGHRWVRIDPAGLRRARAVLSEQRTRRATVTPTELLAIAAGLGGAGRPGAVAPDDDPVTVTLTAAGSGPLADTDHGTGRGIERAGLAGGHVEDRSIEDWVRDLIVGLPDDRLAEVREPDGFVGELRHYQRRALGWLGFLSRLGLGGCLADDMGLGKTATTLAHLVDRPGPHLVVCPLSVVHNWEAEARRFTPSIPVRVHHGAGRVGAAGPDDADALFVDEPAAAVAPGITVTTYGLLARDTVLAEQDWATVIFDEAQTIKNPQTKAARAARRLRAGQRLALTGTPVENRLDELWAIMDLVNPGSLGARERFREQVAMPIERHGDTDVAERLRARIGPFLLRRTKADRSLLPELPDKIEQVAFATLTREQAVLYQRVADQLVADASELDGMQRRGRVLAALTRLKQICNHPAQALADDGRLSGRSGKLHRFDELVDELLDASEHALVFTQFREMGELLVRHLRERLELDAPFLHGGVTRTRRAEMVDRFQQRIGSPLLLVSLKAGGTGLNLTTASQVIHYDRWWNPAVEDQATDRAWRLGQQRTVLVHKLVCQGTVEERIGEVIDDKRRLADAVVGSGEAWLSELSTEQLHDLVRLDRGATNP